MRKSLVSLFLFVLLTVIAPAAAQAQYSVKVGDTLWGIAEKNMDAATAWNQIYARNAFLQEPGRRFDQGGRTIVLINQGELLYGVNKYGILSSPPAVTTLPPETTSTSAGLLKLLKNPALWLVAFILALVGVITLVSKWRRRKELARDPVTSGTPYVPGGIQPTETERLRNFYELQAVNNYAERNPQLDRNSIRVEQIGAIEAGIIVGEGEVGSLGGSWSQHRIETPLDAYQGRFRYPDGTEEILQSLAGCMNPVRGYGGDVMRGFTFTPREAVVPASTPDLLLNLPVTPVRQLEETTSAQTGGRFLSYKPTNGSQSSEIRTQGIQLHTFSVLERGMKVIHFTEEATA